jgi:hypothetical protein
MTLVEKTHRLNSSFFSLVWLFFFVFLKSEQKIPKLYQCPLQCVYPGKAYTGVWLNSQQLGKCIFLLWYWEIIPHCVLFIPVSCAVITIHDADISEKQSGVSADGDVLAYKDVNGVTPAKQIRILTTDDIEQGEQGGFAMFVKQDGPLTSIDQSSPACGRIDSTKRYCGRIAVGGWGYNANLTSPSIVLYTIAAIFFFGMVLQKVAHLAYAGIVGG